MISHIYGNDLIGQAKPRGLGTDRFAYLKDHLGSIRVTFEAGTTYLSDAFSGTLSQWTVGDGGGFYVSSGELRSGDEGWDTGWKNVLLGNSSETFSDGIVTSKIKALDGTYCYGGLAFRYQNSTNQYFASVTNNQVFLYEKISGAVYQRGSASISSISQNTWYTMKVELTGATVKVYWEGSLKITWTDGSPWYSGKVGVIVAADYMCAWDEFNAYTNPTAGIVAYDDYDPWGMVLEGRSGVSGNPDTRYKFTEKERDAETGLDYFGARYYDSRIGRWMAVDALAKKYLHLSPYIYVANSPMSLIDPNGKEITVKKHTTSEGKTAYEIKYTATIVNQSSWNFTSAELEKTRVAIVRQIESSFTGASDDGSVQWKTTADIVVGEQVRMGDNTIAITDPGKMMREGSVGESGIGSPLQKISSELIKGENVDHIGRTGAHEFGHSAQLNHPKDGHNNEIRYEQDTGNLMQQSAFSKGTRVDQAQIEKMKELKLRKEQE